MRPRLADARVADADEPRLLTQLRQVRGTEVAHARLDATDELREHRVHRSRRLLERLDAFGRYLRGRGGRMAVARRRTGLHRRQAAHAAILFVELAVDFQNLSRRLRATGEDAAANHR